MGEVIAPKILASSEWSPSRFCLHILVEREARTIASLDYPHICTFFDIGNQEGTDFW
jgi:hypothetical protein